jgi:hypothetical protein
MAKYDGGSFSGATVTTQNGVELDQTENTATVNFTVSGGPVALSLVSYDVPSGASLGFDASNATNQDIFDLDYGSFDGDGSLTVALPTKTNLAANHSAENGDLSTDSPNAWGSGVIQDPDGSISLSYVDSESRTGSRSMRIDCPSSDSAEGFWQVGGISYDPNKSYAVSGWIKTDNISLDGAPAGVELEANDGNSFIRNPEDALTGTNPWTYLTLRVRLDSVANNPGVAVFRYPHLGKASGTAWFDDMVVREIPGQDPQYGREAAYTLDGTTATNSVTGVDASVTGSPTTGTVGIDGDAFGFSTNADTNTAADALTSGNALDINGSYSTVAGWFNYTGNEAGGRVLQVGGSADTTPTDGFNLEISSGNMALAEWSGGVFTNQGGFGVSTNKWYFVVVVRDGSNYRYHLFDENGELGASPKTGSTSRGTSSSENLILMAGDGRDVAGRLDQVRAYSRAFTESETWRLYQGLQGQLEAYYSLDGGTATNSVTQADATVTGDPTSGETGINGSAFGFTLNSDGSVADEALASANALDINGVAFTVAGWINQTGHEGAGRLFQTSGGVDSQPTNGFSLEFGNDDIKPVGWDNGAAYFESTTLPVPQNEWRFVALAVDGNDFRLHVYDTNGEISGSPVTYNLTRGQTTGETLYMMAGDGTDVAGRLDEVYAYSRQFSASEIQTLYNDSQT